VEYKDDTSLIEKIQKDGCEESLKEIIKRHSPIFYDIYGRFSSLLYSRNINTQDVIEDKNTLIWKSIQSYNPEKKSKFSTWLANQTRYLCLNLLNQKMNYVQMEEVELARRHEKASIPEEDNFLTIKNNIFDVLDSLKDKRVSKIFELRYYSDKKDRAWKEIGKSLNISVQTAINLHKKGKKIIKSRLKTVDNCLK
jgi:RNA polymerase sigma factor (sigma-70 family)